MVNMQTIATWLETGQKTNATHVLIVCDTFDYRDYPVYVKPKQDPRDIFERYNGKKMQQVIEVYNLSMDIGEQLNEHRSIHF